MANNSKEQTISGPRSGTAVRERGQARVAEIVKTAQSILVNEGLAAFTTRRVARELDISMGNLLYYFPNKADLIGRTAPPLLWH